MARRFIPDEASRKFGIALAIEAGVSPEKTTNWSAETGSGRDPNEVRVEFTVVHVMSVDRFNELFAEAQQ